MRRSWVWVLLLLAAAAGEAGAATQVLNLRRWSGPDYTRVVLDLDGIPAYEIPASAEPRLTVRLRNALLPKGEQEIAVHDGIVRSLRLEPREGKEVEITIALVRPTKWKAFVLKGSGGKPNRLVIDIFKPGPGEQKPQPKRAVEKPKEEAQPVLEKPKEEAKEEAPQEVPPPPKKAETPPAEEASPQDTGQAVSRLLEIRHWSAPDHTRLVVDLQGTPTYEVVPSADLLQFTLRFRKASLARGPQELQINDAIVRQARLERVDQDEARLVVTMVKPAPGNIFLLKPYLDKPARLVIDLSRPDLEEKERKERQVMQELKTKKTRIIVLDPGHGGEDPGAIGPRGTREKDVVLALARRLQKSLDDSGDVRAFLTRRGDYFVPLNERIKIAQEYGADLFISLHANGSPRRQTRGTSVYCLSPKGASDKAAQLLAQKENASDLMGGTGRAVRKDLDTILLDLEQTHTINESLHLGGLMLTELGRANHIQFSTPRQAGFAVLKAPTIPSVLVETAYVTHPVEEKFLRQESFQMTLARSILGAVKKFIPLLSLKEGPGK